MTGTYTTTSTFTRTNAKYLASKVAADLLQMQIFYGKPSDQQIDEYIEEVVILLLGGYLKSVTYGFKRGNDWVVALNYSVDSAGILQDDRSGSVPYGADISGASWYSHLIHSPAFYRLSQSQVESLGLPISRSHGDEPRANGSWMSDRAYSNGGVGLQRRTFSSS